MTSMSTGADLVPFTHQWVHDDVLQKERVHKFSREHMDPNAKGFSHVTDLKKLKETVVSIINENIDAINLASSDNHQIQRLSIIDSPQEDGNIVQGLNTILSHSVFTIIPLDIRAPPENPLNYKTCKGGPDCPNAVAYIQYYVALACKCVSIDRTLKLPDGNCHETLLRNATIDFTTNVFFNNETNGYNSEIKGTGFTVSINAEKDSMMKLTDIVNNRDIITVVLTDYDPKKIRCICLVCIYYFTTYAMLHSPNINETNLLNMIKCWTKTGVIQLPPLRRPAGWTPIDR